jgi:hypothetical protein
MTLTRTLIRAGHQRRSSRGMGTYIIQHGRPPALTLILAACSVGRGFEESPGRELAPRVPASPLGGFSAGRRAQGAGRPSGGPDQLPGLARNQRASGAGGSWQRWQAARPCGEFRARGYGRIAAGHARRRAQGVPGAVGILLRVSRGSHPPMQPCLRISLGSTAKSATTANKGRWD